MNNDEALVKVRLPGPLQEPPLAEISAQIYIWIINDVDAK
jgi:hypothetical protein